MSKKYKLVAKLGEDFVVKAVYPVELQDIKGDKDEKLAIQMAKDFLFPYLWRLSGEAVLSVDNDVVCRLRKDHEHDPRSLSVHYP